MTVEHASDVTVSVHANLKTGPCSHCGKPTELTSIAVERLTLGKPVYCDACKNSPSVPFVPGCPHGWAAPSICLTCSPAVPFPTSKAPYERPLFCPVCATEGPFEETTPGNPWHARYTCNCGTRWKMEP
jgi:NAD-dependent SIR2 family protein deacetylase